MQKISLNIPNHLATFIDKKIRKKYTEDEKKRLSILSTDRQSLFECFMQM